MTRWVTFDSSAIEAVSYDATNRTLDVEFRGDIRVVTHKCPRLLSGAVESGVRRSGFGIRLKAGSIM
jgi:hypothetical protein